MWLTLETTYETIRINDLGNKLWCPKECFKPLYEIRNKKIDKLLR